MITWLIKLTGSSKWAYLILAGVAAALVASACARSYSAGYKAADQKALVAQLKQDKQALQQQVTTATLTINQRDQVIAQQEQLRHENAQLTRRLAQANNQQRIVYRTLRSEAAALTAQRAVDSDAGPQCVFDAEFVSVWNAALDPAGAYGTRDAAGGPADAAARASAVAADAENDSASGRSAGTATGVSADGLSAGVSVGDLLANHLDNRELDSAIRNQCTALIEWHQQHDPQ